MITSASFAAPDAQPPHAQSANAPPHRPGYRTRLLRDPAWHLMALLAVAIAGGGGGVGAGAGNLAVQLAALAAMALHPRAFSLFFLRKPRVLTVLVALTLLLPLLQVIPLPPAIWSALPGRDMVAGAFAATAGTGGEAHRQWFTFSLFPARTLVAALGLMTPVTVLVVGTVLPEQRRNHLAAVVAGLGVAAMLFGTMHLFNPDFGYLYESANTQYGANVLLGTFADRNANALFFDAGLLLLAGLPSASVSPAQLCGRIAAGVLLTLGVILTQSRTGAILLAMPLGLLLLRGLATLIREPLNRGAPSDRGADDGPAPAVPSPGLPPFLAGAIVALTILTLVVAATAFAAQGRLAGTLDRFDSAGDGKRAEMREDALKAARHYWPAGAGMGTFSEVFQVDESLEYLSARTAGRAHMDYYELAVESGLPGLALLAGWIAWVLAATWQAMRRADWMALAGAGILGSIAAQSFLSFPLRNQTMLAMAALALVLLCRPMRRKTEQHA